MLHLNKVTHKFYLIIACITLLILLIALTVYLSVKDLKKSNLVNYLLIGFCVLALVIGIVVSVMTYLSDNSKKKNSLLGESLVTKEIDSFVTEEINLQKFQLDLECEQVVGKLLKLKKSLLKAIYFNNFSIEKSKQILDHYTNELGKLQCIQMKRKIIEEESKNVSYDVKIQNLQYEQTLKHVENEFLKHIEFDAYLQKVFYDNVIDIDVFCANLPSIMYTFKLASSMLHIMGKFENNDLQSFSQYCQEVYHFDCKEALYFQQFFYTKLMHNLDEKVHTLPVKINEIRLNYDKVNENISISSCNIGLLVSKKRQLHSKIVNNISDLNFTTAKRSEILNSIRCLLMMENPEQIIKNSSNYTMEKMSNALISWKKGKYIQGIDDTDETIAQLQQNVNEVIECQSNLVISIEKKEEMNILLRSLNSTIFNFEKGISELISMLRSDTGAVASTNFAQNLVDIKNLLSLDEVRVIKKYEPKINVLCSELKNTEITQENILSDMKLCIQKFEKIVCDKSLVQFSFIAGALESFCSIVQQLQEVIQCTAFYDSQDIIKYNEGFGSNTKAQLIFLNQALNFIDIRYNHVINVNSKIKHLRHVLTDIHSVMKLRLELHYVIKTLSYTMLDSIHDINLAETQCAKIEKLSHYCLIIYEQNNNLFKIKSDIIDFLKENADLLALFSTEELEILKKEERIEQFLKVLRKSIDFKVHENLEQQNQSSVAHALNDLLENEAVLLANLRDVLGLDNGKNKLTKCLGELLKFKEEGLCTSLQYQDDLRKTIKKEIDCSMIQMLKFQQAIACVSNNLDLNDQMIHSEAILKSEIIYVLNQCICEEQEQVMLTQSTDEDVQKLVVLLCALLTNAEDSICFVSQEADDVDKMLCELGKKCSDQLLCGLPEFQCTIENQYEIKTVSQKLKKLADLASQLQQKKELALITRTKKDKSIQELEDILLQQDLIIPQNAVESLKEIAVLQDQKLVFTDESALKVKVVNALSNVEDVIKILYALGIAQSNILDQYTEYNLLYDQSLKQLMIKDTQFSIFNELVVQLQERLCKMSYEYAEFNCMKKEFLEDRMFYNVLNKEDICYKFSELLKSIAIGKCKEEDFCKFDQVLKDTTQGIVSEYEKRLSICKNELLEEVCDFASLIDNALEELYNSVLINSTEAYCVELCNSYKSLLQKQKDLLKKLSVDLQEKTVESDVYLELSNLMHQFHQESCMIQSLDFAIGNIITSFNSYEEKFAQGNYTLYLTSLIKLLIYHLLKASIVTNQSFTEVCQECKEQELINNNVMTKLTRVIHRNMSYLVYSNDVFYPKDLEHLSLIDSILIEKKIKQHLVKVFEELEHNVKIRVKCTNNVLMMTMEADYIKSIKEDIAKYQVIANSHFVSLRLHKNTQSFINDFNDINNELVQYISNIVPVQQQLQQQLQLEQKLERQKLERQKLEQKKLERKKLEQQELERKKLEQQELEQQELERKKLEQQELEQPELEQPELEQPELEQPELEQPELEQPELEQPELEQSQLEPIPVTNELVQQSMNDVITTQQQSSITVL